MGTVTASAERNRLSEEAGVGDLREALEGMVEQFGYRSRNGRGRFFFTGGLSALEDAFDSLGWDDPHYVKGGGCEVRGCGEWATCVAPYPRSLARKGTPPDEAGFGFLCSEHMRRWSGPNATETPSDLGRVA